MKKLIVSLIIATVVLIGCQQTENTSTEEAAPASAIQTPSTGTYNIVQVLPHNTSSFTQGLIWFNNTLYEGTGLPNQSKLLKTDLATGKALQSISLADTLFGEGITIYNSKIYQLTWQNHKVFVYDVNTFKKEKEFNWTFEGWGITHFKNQLIISTGIDLVQPDADLPASGVVQPQIDQRLARVVVSLAAGDQAEAVVRALNRVVVQPVGAYVSQRGVPLEVK